MKDQKAKVYNKLITIVDERIDMASKAIKVIDESHESETKSSAGDKFETGRTMMQAERQKSETQLRRAMDLKNDLVKVKMTRRYDEVDFGSMVITNKGTYFMAIGLGKVDVEGKPYFCISFASPIGQLLKDKKVGDTIVFRENKIKIKEIV